MKCVRVMRDFEESLCDLMVLDCSTVRFREIAL